jgi:hypothetical protein
VFEDRLWVIGGAGRRDVWHSANGRDWTQTTPEAEWGARQNNGTAVLGEKLWVFGGRGFNDVWFSSDGSRWTQNTNIVPWSPRTAAHSVVFDDKLWIYSGKTGKEASWAGDVWTMSYPR